MAGGADVLVDLEAALGGGAIVGAERALEVPVLVRRVDFLLGGDGDGAGGQDGKGERARNQELTHDPYPTFFLSTESAMLGGNGSGRSILPRIGSSSRKWKK